MNLTDKMAYLRGMVDGMELDLTSTKEGKVLGQLLDVMQDLTAYVSDLQTQVDELTEVCDLFDQDLGDLEDIVWTTTLLKCRSTCRQRTILRNKIRLLSVYTAALQICISNKPAVCRLVSFGLSEFGDVSGYGTGSGTVNEIA